MKNPLGIHGMVFRRETDTEAILAGLSAAARHGYDVFEIPVGDPEDIDPVAVKALAEELGMEVGSSFALGADQDISSEDPEVVQRGVDTLESVVRFTNAVGGARVGGVLASAMTKYNAPPTSKGRANSVAAIRDLGALAAELDVSLLVEVVNRFETNLFNRTVDGVAYLDEVGRDDIKLLFDVYHGVIEEDSMRAAILGAGDRLGYVHVGQNDRGSLLSGTVNLPEAFAALAEVGYTGPISLEAFSREPADQILANTLGIWRTTWTSGDQLAAETIDYLRTNLALV